MAARYCGSSVRAFSVGLGGEGGVVVSGLAILDGAFTEPGCVILDCVAGLIGWLFLFVCRGRMA